MRELMADGVADSRQSTREAVRYLYEIMERSGPFDGVIGYSEGATVAATLLLCEKARGAKGLRCGVFFMGWPPMDPEGFSLVLGDESPWGIDVPTCHVSECSLSCSLSAARTSPHVRAGSGPG